MPSHVQTERPLAQKDFAGAGPAHHRTETAARHALASDTPDAALNQSLRSQSLLQTRQALEDSPGVRSQLALQRELNRRPPRQADATQDSRKISAPVQRKPNATGLPDRLKAGVEQLSGLAMDDVRVHYNSSKPATVQAHAYAQGTDIHVGPGQEQHLPHEAWHVVQQKQGRVKPTLQMKGVAINDDDGLEREADAMGWRALRADTSFDFAPRRQSAAISAGAVQAFMNLSEVKADQTTWDYINREFKKVETEYLEAVVKKHNLNWEQNPNHLGIEARRPIVDRIVKDKIADVGDCKESDLKEIVRLMNVMEADKQAQKMGGRKAGDPEGEASDIKIGTEFTFYDPKGAFDGMKVGQSSAADTFMAAWTDLDLQQHPKPAMADAKKSKYPKFAKTFTYDLGDGAQWSWTLDVDEGCLETQTTPSTLQQFGEKRIQKIIKTDIFGAAKKVNLLPGKGEGHISLDAETTFGGSAEHLLVLLKDLQNEFQTWAKDFYKDTEEEIFEESEILNAAWIGEMTPIHKYVEQVDGLLVQARSGRLDIFGVVDELKAINTKLKNPVAEKYLEKGT